MVKETFGTTNDLIQHMGPGRFMTYLTASSEKEMQKKLRSIKFPFEVLSAYGMNNKHYVLIKSLRKIKE